MGRPASRRLIRYGLAVGALFLSVAVSLTTLTAVERDSRFCVACHLHESKFTRFTTPPPADLVALHRVKKPEFQCIDCHGGADLGMRGRVWAGAAWDTARYLLGRSQEPTHMRLPLRDAECRQCHDPIMPAVASARRPPSPGSVASTPLSSSDEAAVSSYAADPHAERVGGTAYHAVREHNTVVVRCVRCHTSHTTDGDPGRGAVSEARLRPICRDCHKTM